MSTLRQARLKRGLKIIEAARLLGTDYGNLSRIERGLQYPRIPLARVMCDLYGVSMDDVFSPAPAPEGRPS